LYKSLAFQNKNSSKSKGKSSKYTHLPIKYFPISTFISKEPEPVITIFILSEKMSKISLTIFPIFLQYCASSMYKIFLSRYLFINSLGFSSRDFNKVSSSRVIYSPLYFSFKCNNKVVFHFV
jgi:hypothetical protein